MAAAVEQSSSVVRNKMHNDLARAAENLQVELPSLAAASKKAEDDVRRFKASIMEHWKKSPDLRSADDYRDVDLVLLGSIARQEVTKGSDCDYLVLQNGCTPEISQRLLTVADRVREELEYAEPGRQGVFGDIVIAANLYERIGLESDSNQNLTHRMLLLTESASVFQESTYHNVIGNILHRYCADYLPPRRSPNATTKVPRHLVNDLVRLWRTIAVDFGAKRWRSKRDDSFLRLVKLRTTRKILFAGPLCTLLLAPDRASNARDLPDYLRRWLAKPPLAQLASLASDDTVAPRVSTNSRKALEKLLKAYDSLLELLDQDEVRTALKDKESEPQLFEETMQRCQDIAETIQLALQSIFFDDAILKDRFRKYSVF
jgi:hypothetical protein